MNYRRKFFVYRGCRYRITQFYRIGTTMRVSGQSRSGAFSGTHDGPIKGLKFCWS